MKKKNKSSNKVNSVLEQIHHIDENDTVDDDDNHLTLPPYPTSMSSEKKEAFKQPSQPPISIYQSNEPQPLPSDTFSEIKNYRNINQNEVNEYYRKHLPKQNIHLDENNQNDYLKKLNYIIHLLEEQQEEKTNHVTEEVVLYCFLGIFIIFIVDSFTKSRKYFR
jgi:hypothetical protein